MDGGIEEWQVGKWSSCFDGGILVLMRGQGVQVYVIWSYILIQLAKKQKCRRIIQSIIVHQQKQWSFFSQFYLSSVSLSPPHIQIKNMGKILLLAFILLLAQGYTVSERPASRNAAAGLQSQGLSINSEVKAFLLNLISNAFLYNGEDAAANAFYITQKLNNSTYSGNWNTIIAVNCTYPSGYGAYSAQGSWWAYWNKVNQYALDWCYYLTKMPSTAGRYANRSGVDLGVGDGVTQEEIEVLNKLIDKGFSIYRGSENGNAFFVSDEAGKALGGSWDVLVLNSTSQFYSSTYSIGEKWQNLNGVTDLNRRYFIRKVWNQS